MATNKNRYYEDVLNRRKKSEVEKMIDLKKQKKGSLTMPKVKEKEKSDEPRKRTKMTPVKLTPQQKLRGLERAALRKNFLKTGKKK